MRALVTPGEPTVVAGDLNTVTIGEGPQLRRDLASWVSKNGRDKALFDCSRGDDTTTFSAAVIVRLRIDWMLLQSDPSIVDCPVGSYDVVGNDGASDHKPIITEMQVRPRI